MKRQKCHGEQAFDAYYAGIFGDRWQTLKASLLQPPNPAALHTGADTAAYYMDRASIAAAASLPLRGAKHILDMCAAPGGKTLVMSVLMDKGCRLLANDRSADRVNRLKKVLDESLDESVRTSIDVCCKDAAAMCRLNSECFDRILLDAPCSSERHILSSPHHLDIWTPARIRTLAYTQWSLLSSAYRMLKPDGYIVYSTCALSASENDVIVSKLSSRFDNAEYIREFDFDRRILSYTDGGSLPAGEPTQYGYHILPDIAGGCGPIYCCLIHKKTIC